MNKKLIHTEDNFLDITTFSQRSITVYNDQIMGVKVHFSSLTNEKGLHSHPHTQLTYITKGSFKFFKDREEIIVKAGNALLFEPNVEHGCIPLSSDAELFDVFIPLRKDFI